MSSQPRPVSHPWRRYLRFSIRGLIVLVLVIGLGLGWIVRSARIQRDAVAAITNAGGSVKYDWDRINGNSIVGGKPWAPKWLTDLIGVDYFGHVTDVDLIGSSSAADAAILQVGRLTRVESLGLLGSSVSDAGLEPMKWLTQLSILSVGHTDVTDAGLEHLKALSKLTELDLNGTRVSDAGLVHLKGLTNLSVLFLDDTRVTDAGAKELEQAMPRLKIFR